MEEKDLQKEEEKEHEEEGREDSVEEKKEEQNVDDEIEKLQLDLKQTQNEKEEIYQRLLRIQAEYDNFKKRTQKEKEADRKYKSQDLINELLPAIDNFERALQVEVTESTKSIIEGITMVYNQLKDAMKSQGVEEIETVGKDFDPNYHHAVMQVEDDSQEPNVVVEELQKGYLLKDRVIRPAMVKVNK